MHDAKEVGFLDAIDLSCRCPYDSKCDGLIGIQFYLYTRTEVRGRRGAGMGGGVTHVDGKDAIFC